MMSRASPSPSPPKEDKIEFSTLEERLQSVLEIIEDEPIPDRLLALAEELQRAIERRLRSS
jgi:hypothetical protein